MCTVDVLGYLIIKKYIVDNINDDEKYIITTRLDNDDAIHQKFIDTIQKLAIEKNETVIDLRKGYKLNMAPASIRQHSYFFLVKAALVFILISFLFLRVVFL